VAVSCLDPVSHRVGFQCMWWGDLSSNTSRKEGGREAGLCEKSQSVSQRKYQSPLCRVWLAVGRVSILSYHNITSI
jgi:hypothetical protein